MRWPEITTLRKFYGSRLGGLAQHYIAQALQPCSQKLGRHNVLGLGYAIPHLSPFFDKKNHVVAVTPAHEGGIHWPYHAPCLSAMAVELELPFANNSMDLVIVAHALEYSEQPVHLMQEIWRVLAASGQVIVIVPNRKGVWARADVTPFGSGQPYSAGQLNDLFSEVAFTPLEHETCLFFPPNESLYARPYRLWEKVGKCIAPSFGGLLIGHAKKQVYALHKEPKRKLSIKPAFKPAMGSAMDSSHN